MSLDRNKGARGPPLSSLLCALVLTSESWLHGQSPTDFT